VAETTLSERAQKALRLFEDGCLTNRADFMTRLRERQRAYHAILDQRKDAAQWQSKLAPPFVQHIVESTMAAIVDGKLSYRVKPRPRFFDAGEYERILAGAKAHEILHGAQLKADRFHEMQQPFALQDAIAGITVAKTFWRRDVRLRPRLKVVPDERALELGHFMPRLVETEELDVCYDGPTTEVVNVEDFFWHEASTSLQASPVIAHRVWMTIADLRRLEKQGQYQNVDELVDARDQASEYAERRITDGSSRTKDMIEVLEIWWIEPEGRYRVTLGNRRVELATPKLNPFWHAEYPFTVCTTRPDMFSLPGKSQVEKIAELQEARWDFENQTRDNVRLINNAIFMINDEVSDPDSFEFAPGARWLVEGNPNEMMQSWSPNPISAEVAMPHMARLEQTMQNLAGGYPFTTTSEGGVDASTATQAALVTNIAQQASVRLKEQLAYAYERIGQHRTELNQQFLRVPVMVEQIGLDSASELVEIAPYLLQGEYLFDISPMVESLMRSERRAEGNSMLQMFLNSAQVWMALAQAGLATPPNANEFIRQWLDSYEVGDPDRFFSSRQLQQQQPGAVPGPSPDGPAPPPVGPPPGVTAPQATAADTSPSAQASLSAATHMQRLGAMSGGAANA
jgi:hypothetical protein